MFARVLTIHMQTDKTQDAVTIYRDSILPAAEQQKGFSGALLLTDPVTGKGISITLWETEVDQKASESSGYLQQQLAKVAPLFAGAPLRETYEVSVKAGAHREDYF